MVPITITETASAPGHRFSSTSVASSMSLAEPDRSRIAPMKMNMGIDASTGSSATPPHMRSTTSDMPIILNTPSHAPNERKDERQPAHDEGHRVAHENEEKHRHEHDQGEVVGQPVEHDDSSRLLD